MFAILAASTATAVVIVGISTYVFRMNRPALSSTGRGRAGQSLAGQSGTGENTAGQGAGRHGVRRGHSDLQETAEPEGAADTPPSTDSGVTVDGRNVADHRDTVDDQDTANHRNTVNDPFAENRQDTENHRDAEEHRDTVNDPFPEDDRGAEEMGRSLPAPDSTGPLPSRALVFDAAGRTNAGARGENADGFLIQDRLIAVADGVTAATESRWASALALGAVVGDQAGSPPDPLRGLQDSLEVANEALRRKGRDAPELIGMATTLDLVTLAETGGRWIAAFAHVGSGAVYAFTGPGEGRILTTPHRFGTGPLLRAVGAEETLHSDVDMIDIQPGTLIIVVTNGLTDVLAFPDVQSVVRRHFDAPAHLCAGALLDAAYRRSTGDDVTVVVARVIEITRYVWPRMP
ncbi:PP2C family protein-serine/threonine phosphatase [Streptosporangium sp. NPDC004631]